MLALIRSFFECPDRFLVSEGIADEITIISERSVHTQASYCLTKTLWSPVALREVLKGGRGHVLRKPSKEFGIFQSFRNV